MGSNCHSKCRWREVLEACRGGSSGSSKWLQERQSALKEAKDKLEKTVEEELTWRLQLEKRLRTDLEESKGQEIAKLQNCFCKAMQSAKVDENKCTACQRTRGYRGRKAYRRSTLRLSKGNYLSLVQDTQKKICKSLGLSAVKRVLYNFKPDEFLPDPVPSGVLEELNRECLLKSIKKDQIPFPHPAAPVVYSPPSSTDVKEAVTEARSRTKLERNGSLVKWTGYASDEDMYDIDSSFTSIILETPVSPPSGDETQNKDTGMNVSEMLLLIWDGRETVLDLAKFVDKGVQVKLTGGRQVTGTLKGYDQLLNLVLDEANRVSEESDSYGSCEHRILQNARFVAGGTAVMLVSPTDGTDEIANPFVQPEGA
ncbi:hypothetical protein J5N97_005390 [Dioscorea zingiberensis]|uniref:Sm domain-containing protein n=1 Tax=Dioscorea zingiberensis TaxID=325984 RepID=A0A9D5HSA3_9LILI|nr:hypothetical protein J5N97_005390 [Dioscorea zingiberensis]